MSKNNMLTRICKQCGISFLGGPRAWFCTVCREERKKKQNIACKDRKKLDHIIPLGSPIPCEICGVEIVRTSGRKKYCDACGKTHLKMIDNAQSLEWKSKNLDKIKEAKQIYERNRNCGEGKCSNIKYITWNKSKRKWRVCPYLDKKRIHLGYFAELDEAKTVLYNYLSKKEN